MTTEQNGATGSTKGGAKGGKKGGKSSQNPENNPEKVKKKPKKSGTAMPNYMQVVKDSFMKYSKYWKVQPKEDGEEERGYF